MNVLKCSMYKGPIGCNCHLMHQKQDGDLASPLFQRGELNTYESIQFLNLVSNAK